jgi:hypothetical protein
MKISDIVEGYHESKVVVTVKANRVVAEELRHISGACDIPD